MYPETVSRLEGIIEDSKSLPPDGLAMIRLAETS
jgi:hypothetical protein